MALPWTVEAEEALERAPRILRPLIRRRLEAVAQREQRGAIDLAFLLRIKDQQGPRQDGTERPEAQTSKKDYRIGEDLAFLAELCDQYCTSAHPSAQRRPVVPTGVLARHLRSEQAPSLCPDCRMLFLHASAKRTICPHDPKPSCRHCTTPCHQPEYRQQLAQIMTWNVEQSSPLRED